MDIDIDFQSDFDPTKIIEHAIPASRVEGTRLVKHACGHYLQTMPVDEYTGVAAIPFKEAAQLGFFKVDFLHLSTLNHFKSKTEIRSLVRKEPDWSLLLDPEQVAKLSQIKNSGDLMQRIKPRSVDELADAIALIRPGKRYLLEKYIKQRAAIREELYSPRSDSYCYKRPHALAYALTIVLELHLITQGRL